jgi:hypothetical protein
MSETSTDGTYERPNPTTVTEVLQGTKETLQRLGRSQGKDFRSDGTVCLQGAALVAAGLNAPDGTDLGRDPQRSALLINALNALSAVTSARSGYGAISYNDLGDTTNEDVYSAIDEAIAAQPTTTSE